MLARRCVQVGLLLLAMAAAPATVPRPLFYLPLDGTTTAALAGGAAEPVRRVTGESDTILELLARARSRFAPGRVGQGYDIGEQPLVYQCAGNFRPDEGTCSFWVAPTWRGDNHALYSALFGAADWGMVYKYLDQSSLTFGTAKPDKDLYYDCGAPDIHEWLPGQWHQVAVTWSRQQNRRQVFVDGTLRGAAPFPFHRPVTSGPLFVGAGCTLYPNPTAQARMDEFALWDQPLDAAALRELHDLGAAGRPLYDAPRPADAATAATQPTHRPQTPPAPATPAPSPVAGTDLLLDGWWALQPARSAGSTPLAPRWGLARVPGYWTARADALDADGTPLNGRWAGRPLADYGVAWLQREFTADAAWRGQSVLLRLGGVDGLAEVFCNGRSLGWLPSWQPERYEVGSLLRYGEPNTVTIALHTRGGSKVAGVYGSVSLAVCAGPRVQDVAIRPHVAPDRLAVECRVWNPGAAADVELEFTVAPKDRPQVTALRFRQRVRLAAGDTVPGPVATRLQRLNVEQPWPDAHRWAVEDPFLYTLRVRLADSEAGPYRFGFREFTQRGADLLLNGVPFHIRGHQIDLAWGDQFARVEELKAAGLNALELSGPISCGWYRDLPYQQKLFEQVLDYCDEHGLVAMPILPDAMVLKDRIFEPEVARLYQQRLDQHLLTYGNHASIGLWYMHFNLAGYLWYVAPSTFDGSYRPHTPAFRTKERYALEAQRLAQQLDPRPLFHHACGNFGDMFTTNCYLGPNSPTQEREEWPSRWAAKRPFPFVAVEHCCMLICYWFRPRQFPLSVVYAGEPIFDEICAMYEGPSAYQRVGERLFDLYDMGRTARPSRTMAMIRHHDGYQAVKSEIARRSLRAWRTWNVSGIDFNAENWDFKDDDGQPLPMMKALARYFGDTDMYLAGPGDDWPSKDHAYFAGETLRKQIVLLNDRQRDVACTLTWSLRDAEGKELDGGRTTAVARAGVPTFAPLSAKLPAVTQRAELTLAVQATTEPPGLFQPEQMALQVFPRTPQPAVGEPVLLYDPVGDTRALLAKAGVTTRPLAGPNDLAGARMLVVGRRGYDAAFLALAKATNLEEQIRRGLRVVVFEQTTARPFGLRLEETSTRDAWAAVADHPLLHGLAAADLHDLRGGSDVIPPYPDAPPETEHRWPARCFKWGNRGVLATYVYAKPHTSAFRPVLQCGFDLAQSPLLEATFGQGTVTLCQLDLTERYGQDPVATGLLDNLLTSPRGPTALRVHATDDVAGKFLSTYGIAAEPFAAGGPGPERHTGLVVKGTRPTEPANLIASAQAGNTVLLLPGAAVPPTPGLELTPQRWFIGRLQADPLLAGLSDGDLFAKAWTTTPAVAAKGGWQPLVTPGLLAVKPWGAGRLVACTLDPSALGERGRVKATRFWSVLLSNLCADRNGDTAFLTAPRDPYLPSSFETIPPYMSW